MSAALNNVTTADAYTAANTLLCEGAVKINIQVSGAAIFYRYVPRTSIHPRRGAFNPEAFLAPGTYLFARQAEEIAVRSAVAGKPAQVTVEALMPGD